MRTVIARWLVGLAKKNSLGGKFYVAFEVVAQKFGKPKSWVKANAKKIVAECGVTADVSENDFEIIVR